MDIHAPTRLQCVVHAVEDFAHVHALRRRAVVFDGFAEVFDAERKLAIVGLDLIRLREVNKALDPGVDQTLYFLPGRFTVWTTGMLSG